MKRLLELNAISQTYDTASEKVDVLRNFSLAVDRGESVAVMGPSGSGKSTILMIAGLMMIPNSGSVSIDGIQVDANEKSRARIRNEFLGFVHQGYAIIDYLKVWGNVAIPLEYTTPKVPRNVRRLRAKTELEKYGIGELSDRKVSEISGGQRQRVAIARATINNRQLLLADEPTAALDIRSRDSIIDIFAQLKSENRGILLATHDYHVAEQCNRIINLE